MNIKTLEDDLLMFLNAFGNIYSKHANKWAFSESFGFMNSLLTDAGNGFTFKLSLGVSNIAEVTKLAEAANAGINVGENVTRIWNKDKFKTTNQSILDIFQLAQEICRME